MFENGVLGMIFEPKRDEVAGEWCRLHNKELYYLHSSPNTFRVKSRRIRWSGHVACKGKRRGEYRILVGRPEGKSPRGKTRHRWEDNIKIYFQEVVLEARTGLIRFRIETGVRLL